MPVALSHALRRAIKFDPAFFEGDCLARFLGLDTARNEGNDLAFLIEQEEALAEARITVVVDRSYSAEGRSLRWDILPVGLRGGVQHAKIALLAWERIVRVIIGSANLGQSAYRSQVETGLVLDAFDGSRVPRPSLRPAHRGIARGRLALPVGCGATRARNVARSKPWIRRSGRSTASDS